MDTTAFLDSVARRLGTSSEQAAAITEATLTTLAERIDPGEARHLSAQLPGDLAPFAFAANQAAERFGPDVFISRVGGRSGTDRARATEGVRAVFDTLQEAVPPTEYEHVVAHLPAEFWDISGSAARYDGAGGG